MKVFELEFNDGVSLKEIREELDYYRSVGDVVRTKINGEMVYSNDENYEETMYRLELGLSKEEYEGYKKTKGEINKLETCIGTAGSIENYGYYRYYFGLASRYVKSEKKDEFFDFILSNFSIYKNSFVLAVQLMLVINNTDLGVYNEINNILNAHRSACSSEIYEYAIDVDRALWLVKQYGKKGSLIDNLFFKDVTRDYIESAKERIDVLELKLK